MSADDINTITTALAETSIAVPDKSAADAVSLSAAEGRRLYIGNLAYASREEELREFFKGYAVESLSIPVNPRTDKAVGYAFVDLATQVEAERAVNELSGKEILERKVSVQLAHKPEEGERAEGADDSGEQRRRVSTRGRGGRPRTGRGGRANRGPRGQGAGANGDVKHEGHAQVNDDGNQSEPKPTPAHQGSAEVAPLTDITNKTYADDEHKTEKSDKTRPRIPRERRERGPPANGVASKTKVMVANLPYDLSEEKLKELFEPYQASSAKIALRPIPRFMIKKLHSRNEPRKGRGFGFVTLASEEQQQQAVAEMNGKTIDGREIAVKIAIDSPDKTDDQEHTDSHGEGVENGAHEANGVHKTEAVQSEVLA